MAHMVIIENKAGEQYAVSLPDFHKLYEEQGFQVLRYEDGTPYEPPQAKAEKPKAEKAAQPSTP